MLLTAYRVSNHVVRLPEQFLFQVTAHADECLVGVGDATFEVGHRYQRLVLGDFGLLLGDRLVVAHVADTPDNK
jgi:hypothetical protein